jgi:CDP-glycerol glycerophosphotransferase
VRPGSRERPRISVVVPVYNVADYLADCLDSILRQSVADIEVVAIDDGSTDGSPAVLAAYADRDARVRVIRQDNAGLGAARNTGIDNARGDYLWFVDSDDLLAPGALQTLLTPLQATGSDFASGNVWRLTSAGTVPARFLAPAFRRARMRTHVRRFPALLADRVAWNKLIRRDFWERNGFRFPTGVHYEDLGVMLPAHYLARSVDVVDRYVYLWRVREDGDRSITQQRADPRSMLDRVRAVVHVSDFLAEHGWWRDKRRYDESAVTHDLRYFLEVLPDAGEEFRTAFLDAVNDYLESVDPRVFAGLPAVRRVQWELVRRRAGEELVQLLRDERDGTAITAVRTGRGWYADLAVRSRTDLAIPDRAFAVGRDLRLVSRIHALDDEGSAVTVRGVARLAFLPEEPVRSLRMLAVPLGRSRPRAVRTTVDPTGRFTVVVAPGGPGRRRGRWRLVAVARVAGLRRVAVWHELDADAERSASVLDTGGAELRVDVVGRGELVVTAGVRPPVVSAAHLDDDVLELSGPAGDVAGPAVRAVAVAADTIVDVPAHLDAGPAGRTFLVRLPLKRLGGSAAGWRLALRSSGTTHRLVWSLPPLDLSASSERVASVGSGADGYALVQ